MDTTILLDYVHPHLKFRSNIAMEFDIFIPSHSIAFEYNGIQHYKFNSLFGNPKCRQNRDEEKKIACIREKIHLIEVPCDWKFDKET
jgi:hypothetical protein